MPFEIGDTVIHKGEVERGKVTNTDYAGLHFKVEWDDGEETIESMHTVERVERADKTD